MIDTNLPRLPREEKNDSFGGLQHFSEELINLGKEIEAKLKERGQLERTIQEKERQANQLRMEIFQLKEKLIKLEIELSRLEKRRQELIGKSS